MTNNETLILFAKGSANWDIFAQLTENGCTLYSIARPGTGARDSIFGNCEHVRHLMHRGYWSYVLTEEGKRLMAAY